MTSWPLFAIVHFHHAVAVLGIEPQQGQQDKADRSPFGFGLCPDALPQVRLDLSQVVLAGSLGHAHVMPQLAARAKFRSSICDRDVTSRLSRRDRVITFRPSTEGR